jgi:CheY-like chemotaxis protein
VLAFFNELAKLKLGCPGYMGIPVEGFCIIMSVTPEASPKQFTVLFAEDNIVLSTAFCRVLAQAGFQVDHCPDGESALQKLKSNIYNIVVLDLMMPRMDGITFLKEAQKFLWKSKTPVIVLSQADLPIVKDEIRKHGVTEFLNKEETTPTKLIEVINTAISSSARQNDVILRMVTPTGVTARRISTLTPNEFAAPREPKSEAGGKGLLEKLFGGKKGVKP